MRKRKLDPPRPAIDAPHAAAAHSGRFTGSSPPDEPAHVSLGAPHRARDRRRRLFNPSTGWFRRTERVVNLWISRHVYPRVPGLPAIYGRQLARELTLAEAEVRLPRLPQPFDGLAILLITDVHVGPFVRPERLAETFVRLLAARPDVVVLAGDLATALESELPPFERAFSALGAVADVIAVPGNHDHYACDMATWTSWMSALGVRVLVNAAHAVERGGSRLAFAGIDDYLVGRPDLDLALRQAALVAPGAPVILVSHNPDVFFEAAARGVPLTLSGHTHGGQIRVPGLPVLVRMSRYRLDEGRYEAPGSEIVVSRGLGVTGLPLRLGCPPEAVLVRLRST